MRHFLSARLLILIAVCIVLEYTLSPAIFLLNGRLDLLYLVVLDYAFFWSWEKVPFFALLIGLILDFFGGHFFGIQTVSLALTGWLLSLGIQKLERDIFWVRIVMTFLFVLCAETLSMILGLSVETSNGFSLHFMGNVFQTSIGTTIFAPAFFWFTRRWFKRVSSALKQYELF